MLPVHPGLETSIHPQILLGRRTHLRLEQIVDALRGIHGARAGRQRCTELQSIARPVAKRHARHQGRTGEPGQQGGRGTRVRHETRYRRDRPSSIDRRRGFVHARWAFLDDGLTLELTRADGTVSRVLAYARGNDLVYDGRTYGDSGPAIALGAPGDAERRDASVGGWLAVFGDAQAEEREESAERKRRLPQRLSQADGPQEQDPGLHAGSGRPPSRS